MTDIAVLIDLENQLNLDLTTVRDHLAGELGGRVAIARAYANWASDRHAKHRTEAGEGGIVAVQCGSFGVASKNAADIELAVDALRLAADAPTLETFVVVTADGDFTPVIHRLRELGKRVVIASVETHVPSQHARAAVDQTLTLPRSGRSGAVEEKPKPVRRSPAKAAADPSRQQAYREAILALLDDAKIGEKFANLAKNRAPMNSVSPMLKKAAPELDHVTAGYRTLAGALRNSLAGTDYDVTVPAEKSQPPRLVLR